MSQPMSSTPKIEVYQRLVKLQQALVDQGLQGALLVQRADVYYFTGTAQDAHLWVRAQGEPVLLVRHSFERARNESPLRDIRPFSRMSELPAQVGWGHVSKGGVIGLEMDVIPAERYLLYTPLFPAAEFTEVSPVIREIRMLKSEYEMTLIRQAASLNDAMFAQVPTMLQEGLTELEFAGKIEAFLRAGGHQGAIRIRSFNQEVFYGHIMAGPSIAMAGVSVGPTGGSGPNPSYPQGASWRRIGRHESVVIDTACAVDGYIVDQARIFSLGKLDAVFHRAHQTALDIQAALVRNAKPGVTGSAMYELALALAQDCPYKEGFMGYPRNVPFVAHGVGLELDEWPIFGRGFDRRLESGMVVALEPKFIFPGQGMAGIENTFWVDSDGLVKLTQFPDEIMEL
ncbi:MAG: aminopeptidase P family protein [Deltaproteobacteria bacterium]|nr:aminopeptidase P family protein [Deltaproteobacteria bacterium]